MRNTEMSAIIVRHVKGYEYFCFEVFYPNAKTYTGVCGQFIKSQPINLTTSGHCQIWKPSIVTTDYYLHDCEPVPDAMAQMVAREIERRYGLGVTLLRSLPPLR